MNRTKRHEKSYSFGINIHKKLRGRGDGRERACAQPSTLAPTPTRDPRAVNANASNDFLQRFQYLGRENAIS